MFQFILVLIIVYCFSTIWKNKNLKENFDDQIHTTPLHEANLLIFSPNFLPSNRRKQPLLNSPQEFGSLWTSESEMHINKLSQFKPRKLHSITFDDQISQITGHIHQTN